MLTCQREVRSEMVIRMAGTDQEMHRKLEALIQELRFPSSPSDLENTR